MIQNVSAEFRSEGQQLMQVPQAGDGSPLRGPTAIVVNCQIVGQTEQSRIAALNAAAVTTVAVQLFPLLMLFSIVA